MDKYFLFFARVSGPVLAWVFGVVIRGGLRLVGIGPNHARIRKGET